MENVNTDQTVERDGGASCQLDQKTTTTATKQRAVTQLTTTNFQCGIGGLRSVAGHHAERADSMLPAEAMMYSANTIADVSHQYEHHTGKVVGRDKCVAKHVSVIRRVKKSEAIDGTQVAFDSDPI